MRASSVLRLLLGVALAAGCASARAANRAATATAGGAAATTRAPAGPLDPSEEITPQELASIPDPVPPAGRPGSAPSPSSAAAARAPDAPQEARSAAPAVGASAASDSASGKAPTPSVPSAGLPSSGSPPPDTPPPASPIGAWTWKVQVLATPDKALAARVAKEAAERLGTVASIAVESGLSKVRLGAFATEAEAQVLKDRAVEMGYPGAFRVKIRAPGTDE